MHTLVNTLTIVLSIFLFQKKVNCSPLWLWQLAIEIGDAQDRICGFVILTARFGSSAQQPASCKPHHVRILYLKKNLSGKGDAFSAMFQCNFHGIFTLSLLFFFFEKACFRLRCWSQGASPPTLQHQAWSSICMSPTIM